MQQDKPKYSLDLSVGNQEYSCSCNHDGTFIYKAKENKALKKDGTLKAQYKEMPRFDVLKEIDIEAEKDSKDWHKAISKLTKQVLN